jgi:hypothetical protein
MSSQSPNDKEIRKAWLKKKFASFEYHEEMLQLHRQFVETIRRALARAVNDQRPDPDYATKAAFARNFERTDWPLIQGNDDLGKYRKDEWHKYYATATFRSIPDYSRYLISEGDRLGWMTPQERDELDRYWGALSQMATNIRRTVDDTWNRTNDDILLDEKFTGPIDWPANWRDEVAAPTESLSLRCEAGQSCPQEGYWFTPAALNSRRYFKQGEVMPDMKSGYGTTIWQWDERQG